jgi:hypothetical protein
MGSVEYRVGTRNHKSLNHPFEETTIYAANPEAIYLINRLLAVSCG